MPLPNRCAADYVFANSDTIFANDEFVRLGNDRVIEISFDRFSDGWGFSYARHIHDSGFSGMLIASGHVIADQADYLQRCGFSHAEIPESKTADWQVALSAIPARFQHMVKSPRSRMYLSVSQHKFGDSWNFSHFSCTLLDKLSQLAHIACIKS